jgi:8-oxo-dGTP pyrophosphatase MutT (NUDIX family)
MIKHATAGAFLFHQGDDGPWRLGLIQHPRLNRWMVPGGHVETDESQLQAALREVEEETGLAHIQLLEAPAPIFPAGFPSTHARVPLPWWITEVDVAPDNHLREPHVHVDHQYVAVADPLPARNGAHPFAWWSEEQVAELPMFEDTKLLSKVLFASIEELTTGHPAKAPVLLS